MRTTTAWKSTNGSTDLERGPLDRRDLRDDDIAVRIDFCGICHSDLHAIGWNKEGFLVPGHEFIGTVTELGSAATRFEPGDRVAIGNIVDSCGVCPMCEIGQENYCWEFPTGAYNGKDRIDGSRTQGGYSREYVLREKFAYPLPDALDPAASAPLMCAGATVWEPMRAAGVGPDTRMAVVGLGGLGHLAVKFGAALGADVTVLSRTADKAADARALGASDLLVTSDEKALGPTRDRFDFVLDTIAGMHDFTPLIGTLALDGELCVVGAPIEAPVNLMKLAFGRKKISASAVGGRRGIAEMLTFAAEHGISANAEVIPSAQVSEGLTRLGKGDVRYRFVLDLSDLDA